MKFGNFNRERNLPPLNASQTPSLPRKFFHEKSRRGRIQELIRKWRLFLLCVAVAWVGAFTPDVASSTTREAGGRGGARFDLACRPGEVMVGVHGKAGSFVDRLGLWCVRVDPKGKWVGNPGRRGAPAGGTGGKSFSLICPRNAAVSGFKGKYGKYVDNLQIQCKHLAQASRTSGKAVYLRAVGGGLLAKAFGPYSCPSGRPAYGAFGKAGIYIDRLGLKCQDEVEWKPRFHFSPRRGWMNDPAGLVFDSGVYHLYYQAVPNQPTFDDNQMEWGHAVSRDLRTWAHQKSVFRKNKDGAPFTGSAIAIKKTNNVCRCSLKSRIQSTCIAAFFTRATTTKQMQVLAPSCNGGASFVNQGSTVRENPSRNPAHIHFRDPKVFWYQPPQKTAKGYWVMVIAAGDSVEFYKSSNLTRWTKLSGTKIYSTYNLQGPFVETPDLVELPVSNGSGNRWVLLFAEGYVPAGICRQFLSGPATIIGNACNKALRAPSSSHYLVGHFDGTRFRPESVRSGQPLRKSARPLDAGPDFYAPQSWSNARRHIIAGWQNNWLYAHELPTTRWRGSLAIPRELSLAKVGSRHVLLQKPVGVPGRPRGARAVRIPKSTLNTTKVVNGFRAKTFEANITFNIGSAKEVGVHLRAGRKGRTVVKWFRRNTSTKLGFVTLDRRSGWGAGGSPPSGFARSYSTPLVASNGLVKLRILVDRGSVEVFAGEGEAVLSALIFPDIADDQFKVFASGGTATVVGAQLNALE